MPLDSGFQWMTINEVTDTTASGSISGGTGFNDVTVSITQDGGGMGGHSGMYGFGFFPVEYNVPAGGLQIMNTSAGVFQATFNKPITNALVAFASVGNGGTAVPVIVSRPFTPIWQSTEEGTNTVYENPVNATQYTQFTGNEGFNIIRIDGTMTEVTFTYTRSEYYCTVCFGFVDQNDPDLIRETICDPLFAKFAYREEDGCVRFRRLRHLGYV